MNKKEIKERINEISWHHSIEFGNGMVTPGKSNNVKLLQKIQLPENLSGMTLLDIGAWNGFFSFEAEKRGADRVLAIDTWKDSEGVNKNGFDFASKVLNSKVESKVMSVYDISPENTGKFDIVLFLGVLYHLRYPLLALEKISEITKKLLIVETEVDFIREKVPLMTFYPGCKGIRTKETNWWSPNPPAVEFMLKDVGFEKVDLISKESELRRVIRFAYHRIRNKHAFFENIRRNRMIFHAKK